MTGQLRRIERNPRLSDIVQREIKAYILRNGLRTGDPLPSEVSLASQLNVSRNSVRESVKVLETFGLLETRVGAGLFVGQPSLAPILGHLTFGLSNERDQFAEAVETRRWLELGLVDDLVESITRTQLAEINKLLKSWRKATEAGQYPAESDSAFHRLVVKGVSNGLASRLLDLLWEVREQAHDVGAIHEPSDLMANLEHHESIYKALVARDADAVRAAIVGHYDFVRNEVRREASESAKNSAARKSDTR